MNGNWEPPTDLYEAMEPEYRWVQERTDREGLIRLKLTNKPLPRVIEIMNDNEVRLYDTGHSTGRTRMKRKAVARDESAIEWVRKNFRNVQIH